MKRKRPVCPQRPYIATPDQVRITRDAGGANIDYAEENVSGVYLVLRPDELASTTDDEILDVHNRCIEAQEASLATYEYVALEVAPGVRQVKRSSRTGQIVPRGDVLRCHITDAGVEEDDPVAIYIDDEAYSLREFGEILRTYAGWGMRVTFVPHDRVDEEPAVEVRNPRRGR